MPVKPSALPNRSVGSQAANAGRAAYWQGKRVVITGATKGIGRSLALKLHARGAHLGIIARSQTGLESLLQELGGPHHAAPADLSQRAQAEAAIATLANHLQGIDVLVNCAGAGLYGPISDCDPEDVERLMRTNFFSLVYTINAALPYMLQAQSGHIVNVGSVAGRMAAPFEGAYSASKFAVTGYSEALQVELTGSGVGVSLLQPGPVQTGFFETRGHPYTRQFPRPISPARVADAIISAVEGDRFEVMVPRTLGAATMARHLFPSLYLPGIRRAFKREVAASRSQRGGLL